MNLPSLDWSPWLPISAFMIWKGEEAMALSSVSSIPTLLTCSLLQRDAGLSLHISKSSKNCKKAGPRSTFSKQQRATTSLLSQTTAAKITGGVASARRFPSDTGAFADWAASSAVADRGDDLCLGFNAGSGSGSGGGVVWAAAGSSSATGGGGRQTVNYGMPADMGTVVLASAASLQHHHESWLSASEHHPAIIPLLAATPCVVDDDSPAGRGKLGGGIHIWQPAQPQAAPYHHDGHPFPAHHETNPNPNPNPNPTLYNYLRKPIPMLESSVIIGATAGVGASTCQDCGNQAKKDCSHRRCRTCCKSRGLECSTHQNLSQLLKISSCFVSHADAGVKEHLPGHVRVPALFKCVRVTSIDDGDDEYAYHAMVKIGGRVFKGFLYDHGLDDGGGHSDDGKESSIPNISELHLGNRFGGASSSTMQSPSDAFGGGLIGSTHYDNQINE
ncbi:hypothetical protein ZIOFF_007813 [Zingiber officinale]|uniref:Uncharacterized protein n=1 Tax=Zingiber officinale TaxID=94328 RepID=A0A8J5I2A8_ZINOF|nr:hypothetical protein ZIOFF_007813 [Zingiber officinale]